MPRFSIAFSKRKPAADDFENVHSTTTEQPSFRVIERQEANGTSFDGGARMARVPRTAVPRSNVADLNVDDNMFADLKANRGSGLSNKTNATSTDNSSRHSNASTAPSSTDLGAGAGGHDDNHPSSGQPHRDSPSRSESKSSSFLDRATRTFSFGGQKKHSVPAPRESRVPDLPPILSLPGDGGESRSRRMTCSTASTATPTRTETASIDLDGDFESIITSFDNKRASMATLKNNDAVEPRSLTGIRHVPTGSLGQDAATTPAEPLLGRHNSPLDDRTSSMLSYDLSPPAPRHQTPRSDRYSGRPSDMIVDDDANFLRDSFAAINLLSDPNGSANRNQLHRYRRDEDAFAATTPSRSAPKEDNIFEGSLPRASRISHRYVPRASYLSNKNKVMTPAEFEKYRQDKERQDTKQQAASEAVKEEEDEINYEDEDDEQELSKQQARQRRKQEAHMAVYRQQMMKVTGESAAAGAPVQRNARAGLPPSSSAPQLTTTKPLSPDPAAAAAAPPGPDDEDEDEDVPLGILQAHGFPGRNRPPTRLSHAGSNSNLRAAAQGPPPGRPASVSGEAPSSGARRQSALPAFARNLPQDPFVGASLARPALRESLSFGDAGQLAGQHQAPLPPGGLVGVIASEERSRAMRRGSPSLDGIKLPPGMGINGPHGPGGFDPVVGIPHHMMYGPGSMSGMPPMAPPQPSLTPGDQAQIHMTQQMQQFMQMQMHMMQMMAANQGGGGHPMQPPMQPPYGGGLPGSLSMADLSSRHSMTGEPVRLDHGVRTMSMVHPSPPFLQQPQDAQFSAPGPGAGYAPSIAPSERSNVGLPGRYRPVSQAPPPSMNALLPGHQRATTMSGGLSAWGVGKSKSSIQLIDRAGEGSDEDDEEQGWAAMKAQRERKRSMWKSKKSFGSELAL